MSVHYAVVFSICDALQGRQEEAWQQRAPGSELVMKLLSRDVNETAKIANEMGLLALSPR